MTGFEGSPARVIHRVHGTELVRARELRWRVRPLRLRLAAGFSTSVGPPSYHIAGVPYPERTAVQGKPEEAARPRVTGGGDRLIESRLAHVAEVIDPTMEQAH